MPDTIIVALITLFAGFIGAVTGAISTQLVSKRATKVELGKLIHTEKRECYATLLHSYHVFVAKVVAASVDASPLDFDEEWALFTQFQIAYSAALLLASDSTSKALSEFYLCVAETGKSRGRYHDINPAYSRAVNAMRHEVQNLL